MHTTKEANNSENKIVNFVLDKFQNHNSNQITGCY